MRWVRSSIFIAHFKSIQPIRMSSFSQTRQLVPDFRPNEIHCRIDSIERTVSLTFQLLSEFHTMNRGYDEVLEKTLQRFAITCRSKLAKNSHKDARANKKKAGGATTGAEVIVKKPDPAVLLFDGSPMDASLVQNFDIRTGMVVLLDETRYEVVVNPPTVTSLTAYPRYLPYVGCPIIPQVSIEFGDEYSCLWECETSPGSHEFVALCTEKVFVPPATAVGCRVKLFCSASCSTTGRTGRAVVFYLAGTVQPTPENVGDFNRMVAVRSEFCRVRRASDSRSHIPLFNLLSQHDTTKESAVEVPAQRSDNDLRIVSYNILAEPFATSEQAFNTLYPYCDQAYLQSEYRIQRILCELIAYDADVICLQECDLKTFECYLLPILGRLGYAGHFTCKGATEGCAVFTLTTTCTVAARVDLPLKNVLREASYLDTLYEQRPDLRDILGGKLGTVAQLTVLQCVHRPEQALAVANTHLFYHPLASFLRAIQAYAITQALETLCKRIETVGVTHDLTSLVGGEETNTVMLEKEARIEKSLFTNGWVQSSTSIVEDSAVRPLRATAVFCGDLNSSPNFATMNFLLSGYVSDEDLSHVWEEVKHFGWGDREASFLDFPSIHEARRKRLAARVAEQEEEQDSAGLQPILRHSLGFISAGGFPQFSNYSPTFQELLDYVLVQERDMQVVRAAPCPGHEVLGEFTALPSAVIPSDHIAIVGDVRFRD